ncbi:hybrid sensor histidine kinase/response regulator [Pseudochryseolinea flava]|uniref:histidine kinase n=1 Tax=Pseudochryseolinea flava TaxID=2059302 RepID=A0A364Y093_9BACT|nr:response regulator [Pseudochryseolinea flava]RAW00018.1 hybrid sensor histidine kinase/response regulator [Pseudochryseolinea flava]
MILIVDDNQENIFSLKTLLSLHQFDVDTASSGEEALKKILLRSYELIILDVQMPEMDGFEVAEAISGYSKSKDIPIIFLSAVNTHKKFITKGYASGAIDYVTKPFDPDILLMKIKTFYRLSEQTIKLNALEKSLREEIELRKKAEAILEKKVEERTRELKRTNQRLEQSNLELQQFAYVASHDLQEPLRKIQTFSNMALERHLDDQGKIKLYLDKIYNSAKRLRGLVTDLLNYSRINAEEIFVNTNLNQLLNDVLSDLEYPYGNDNPIVRANDIPAIEVIPSQMRQVFQNLLANSFKFSKLGQQCEVDIEAKIVESKSFDAPASALGEYCRIVIRDNGIGFSDEYNHKIFEIFQRLNTRESYAGTGIGLAIVKKVVDRHEGIIAAEGKEGSGATFTIVLPLKHHVNVPVSS